MKLSKPRKSMAVTSAIMALVAVLGFALGFAPFARFDHLLLILAYLLLLGSMLRSD